MMDFSGSAGLETGNGILPKGLLVWANLQVRGVKASGSGGGYLDCELTVADGQPFAGRKLWEMIGDPLNQGNSEKYRQMGNIAIARILECGRGAGPSNPGGYKIAEYRELSGLRVAIKVGIEAGEGGHDDKNRVAEWLTPNPASSSGYKPYQKLLSGDHGLQSAQPSGQAQSGFGGGAPAQPATAGSGFGNATAGTTGAPATSASGFGNQAGNASAPAATSGFGTGNADAGQQTPATDASPSNPENPPNWLAQAGGQAQG